jgi:ChrB-like protein
VTCPTAVGNLPESTNALDVTTVTIWYVTQNAEVSWLVLLVQVPSDPSRYRVAVWRELRRFGAVPIGQGAWTAPDVPACREGAEKAQELARAGHGDLLLLTTGSADADAAKLRALFDAARGDEWAEFVADCGKFREEIALEIAKQKFTLAELEEEEQSLDRLRRWFRSIRGKDVFGTPSASGAEVSLADCVVALEEFAGLVYQELHS